MRKLLRLSVAVLFAGALAACEQQPTTLDSEAKASHGSSGTSEASATYRAVDTEAADKHNFQVGEKVGTLSVTDDGSSLTVTGEASGLMDNDERYISLFYDKASPAQGPHACEPGVTDPDHPLWISPPQMVIGPGSNTVFPPPFGVPHAAWVVDANGDAELGPAGTLEYVSIDKIGTVSIRDLTVSDADLNGDGNDDPGAGPEAVVACGVVTHDRAND